MNSGIYIIFNCVNNKVYVGSAVDFDERWRLHLLALNKNKHHNRHIQQAWNKYGEANFKFYAIEYTSNLLDREQHYIEKLKANDINFGYNICKVARNRQGVKASEETKLKLSISHTGHKQSEEFKSKMSERLKGNTINTGRKQTPEQIEKRIKANTGRKRSEESKARMSAWQVGKVISPETKIKMSISARNRRVRERELDKPLDYTCDMWV